jgi:hypothetical protein
MNGSSMPVFHLDSVRRSGRRSPCLRQRGQGAAILTFTEFPASVVTSAEQSTAST